MQEEDDKLDDGSFEHNKINYSVSDFVYAVPADLVRLGKANLGNNYCGLMFTFEALTLYSLSGLLNLFSNNAIRTRMGYKSRQ